MLNCQVVVLGTLFVMCTSFLCEIRSDNNYLDLSDSSVYLNTDYKCPQELVDYSIVLTSTKKQRVILENPPPMANLKLMSDSDVEIKGKFTAFDINITQPIALYLETYIGSIHCELCAVYIDTGSLFAPKFKSISVKMYLSILSPSQFVTQNITNTNTLSIVSPFPPQINSYSGNPYFTLLSPSSVSTIQNGEIPEHDTVSLLQHTQDVTLKAMVNNLFVSLARATVKAPLQFNSITLVNGFLTITEDISATMFISNSSSVVFKKGTIKAFYCSLISSKVEIHSVEETYFTTHMAFIDSVNVSKYCETSADQFVFLESDTKINFANSPHLQHFENRNIVVFPSSQKVIPMSILKKCHVISKHKKDIYLSGDNVKFRESGCPCENCRYIINEPDEVVVHFDTPLFGGIDCETKCVIRPKQSPTIRYLKGFDVTVDTSAIIALVVPENGGCITLKNQSIIMAILNTKKVTKIIANDFIHFGGTLLSSVYLEVHKSMTFVQRAELIVDKSASIFIERDSYLAIQSKVTVLGNIHFNENTIAPVRVLKGAEIVFGKDSNFALHTNVNTWRGDTQYLILNEEHGFGPDTQLPQLILVDVTTNQISQLGRLFTECFGRWVVYKISSSSIVHCHPVVVTYEETEEQSNTKKCIVFVILLLVVLCMAFYYFKMKQNTQTIMRYREMDDIDDIQKGAEVVVITSDE
ncbi:hypothetical protein EIN_222510 [Entamoeba invadens IP1]|uniref:Uncharacterized protein n=1 Tax=Entamoeba invadens IP1 TaxID=370355 RepID=A0A0A1U805_ENTIV|nr:hypothetical protein EIN_222510 [Entamoeba invadens IP1]ELP88098.1 hypothetical protein EIN_222510 [Entamoeba invadens IP1]|eukprot:XP_004254869.1 hypothetical protein EIN_222510 [Entamoeba invadens IP1]